MVAPLAGASLTASKKPVPKMRRKKNEREGRKRGSEGEEKCKKPNETGKKGEAGTCIVREREREQTLPYSTTYTA